MIAEEGADAAAGRSRFLLYPPDEIEHGYSIRTAIRKVSHEPQGGIAADPA